MPRTGQNSSQSARSDTGAFTFDVSRFGRECTPGRLKADLAKSINELAAWSKSDSEQLRAACIEIVKTPDERLVNACVFDRTALIAGLKAKGVEEELLTVIQKALDKLMPPLPSLRPGKHT